MANFPQDLRSYLAGTTTITSHVGVGATVARIHYNKIPQLSPQSHIWMRTSSDTEQNALDGLGGLHEAFIDLECVGDTEANTQDLADAVKARLDGVSGTVTSHTVQGMWVSDKDDSYLPKSIDSDDGRHIVAFDVRAFYTT